MVNRTVLMLAQRTSVGGVSGHIRVLGKHLADQGWSVHLASNWESPKSVVRQTDFQEVGIHTHQVAFPEVGRKASLLAEIPRAAMSLRQLTRAIRPAVIHSHWRTTLPYLVGLRHPSVFTIHSVEIGGRGTEALYRLPNRIVVISRMLEDEMTGRLGVAERRVRYVPNGVELPDAPLTTEAARRSLGIPIDTFELVTVARLESVKCHETTIEALSLLRASGVDARLTLVGDGSQRESLVTEAELNGVRDQVRFVGHQVPDAYLCSADAFVLASEREGFALAAVEGMMHGLPVLRTPTGGTVDQVREGITGFTFPHKDATQLASKLEELATNAVLRRRLSGAAAERAVMEFSAAVMANRTASVYEELISPSR